MIARMIEGSFDTLANLWKDLAEAFRRLARTFPANSQEETTLDSPPRSQTAGGVTTWPAGFAQLCDFDPAGPNPNSAPAFTRGESVRVSRLKAQLALITTLQVRFKFAVGVFTKSDSRTVADVPNVIPTGDAAIDSAAGVPPRLKPTADEVTYFGGLTDLETDFDSFKTGKPETLELLDCADRIKNIREFIQQFLEETQELLDNNNTTQQHDIRGIRTSVDNIAAYPVLTSEVGFSGGGVAPRGPGNANGGAPALGTRVTAAIREVIGRVPRVADTRSFLASLTQSFEIVQVDGGTQFKWNPRAYSGQTELGGGVTGAQASLYARAKTAVASALPLLDGLYSLREDADDELVASSRGIVRSILNELVEELGTEGGPRTARVDGAFDLLLREQFPPKYVLDNKPVLGHLQLLAFELGLSVEFVNTLDEESNYTNFIALRDYVLSIESGWQGFSADLLGKDLGTRFVQLSRALSVAAESVEELEEAMDSVFVGEAERQVASFRDEKGRRVLVGELLDWVADFATEEAPRLVHDGGRRGATAVIPTAKKLKELVGRFERALDYEPDLPDGMRQARVRNPLRELQQHLVRIERLANDVRQV